MHRTLNQRARPRRADAPCCPPVQSAAVPQQPRRRSLDRCSTSSIRPGGLVGGGHSRAAAIVPQAAAADAPSSPPLLLAAPSLSSLRDRLLRDELPSLFSSPAPGRTSTLSPELYSESLCFQDPLASFAGLPLYELNLSAIRALFDVEFTTHAAVVREADSAVVTRWTMTLAPKFLPDGGLPFLTGRVRRPRMSITGTSVYGVDRGSGKIVSHVDAWDSLPMRRPRGEALRRARAPAGASALGGDGVGSGSEEDDDGGENEEEHAAHALLLPPRPRGLLHVAKRALRAALAVTPDLATPSYAVLFAAPSYELRRYGSFSLAETDMSPGSSPSGGSGFGPLVGYISGGNSEGRKWEMTTPVLTESDELEERQRRAKMAFVLDEPEEAGRRGGNAGDEASTTTPRDPSVRTRVEGGGRLWASIPVKGWPLDADVRRAEKRLRASLQRDGVARALSAPGQYRLLRYNDPLTPPQLRRNELLVEVAFCAGGGGGDGDGAWAEALLKVKK
jgi:hypothetical protein